MLYCRLFRTQTFSESVIEVIFSQRWISRRNDKSFALHASHGIDGRSFFQRQFVSDRDARVHFDFTYLEISFGQFHSVIHIVLESHQTKFVHVTIQNDFDIDKTQQETFASEHDTEQRSRHFENPAFATEHISLFQT